MKIVLAHPRLDRRGGAEHLLCFFARGLVQAGHEVSIYTRDFDAKIWDDDAWSGLSIGTYEPSYFDRFRSRAGRLERLASGLEKLTGEADLCVAVNYPANIWVSLLAKRRPDLRTAWYCNEPPTRLHWRKTMLNLIKGYESSGKQLFKGFVEGMESREKRKGGKLDIDRRFDIEAAKGLGVIMGNSAFTAKNMERAYEREAHPCLIGIPDAPARSQEYSGDPYIAWVSSVVPHKNAPHFLEALALVKEQCKDVKVRATGINNEEFRGLVKEKGLEDVVTLESWISDEDLNNLLWNARFIAYPNIDEPYGLVPVEGMVRKKASLVANVGGPSETVIHEKTGLSVDVTDARAMADGLVTLWNDEDARNRMGEAGRQRYEEALTLEIFVERFLALALG